MSRLRNAWWWAAEHWWGIGCSVLVLLIVMLSFFAGRANGATDIRTIPPDAPSIEDRLRGQILRERRTISGLRQRVKDADRRGYRRARREIVTSPDAQVDVALAGLAYGQSPAALLACASSEGYAPPDSRGSNDRFRTFDTTPNQQGSGAFGFAQFMRGTFESTPQWRLARLDWRRIDVQAHAMAWMWSAGRRGEWAGEHC